MMIRFGMFLMGMMIRFWYITVPVIIYFYFSGKRKLHNLKKKSQNPNKPIDADFTVIDEDEE
jgi:hypothetical protein